MTSSDGSFAGPRPAHVGKDKEGEALNFSFCCTFFQESSAQEAGSDRVDYGRGNSGPIKLLLNYFGQFARLEISADFIWGKFFLSCLVQSFALKKALV